MLIGTFIIAPCLKYDDYLNIDRPEKSTVLEQYLFNSLLRAENRSTASNVLQD